MVRPNPDPTPGPEPAPPSDKRAAANRANARKSTGPRTAEGKQRSRMNAVKHGLAAQTALLPGEDPAALEALARRMHDAHCPAPGLEEVLVERLVSLAWKLRRTGAAEEAVAVEVERRRDGRWASRLQNHRETGRLIPDPGPPPTRRIAADILGSEFFEDDGGPLLRLGAYEARLTTQLLGIARQLEKLQKARADAGEVVAEPEAEAPTQNEAIAVNE